MHFHILQFMKSLRGGPFLHLACQRGRRAPLSPVSYATTHSRKVPCPKPRVKAKSGLSERNYFITMHHQAGVNFENFTEVKFRNILLTGTGHRDKRLNRDCPDQTYVRFNLNQNLKPKSKRPFTIPSFHQKCRPTKSAAPENCPPAPPSRSPVASLLVQCVVRAHRKTAETVSKGGLQ